MNSKNDLIEKLSLIQHVEGGYFSEIYRSSFMIETDRQNNQRSILTSIYYMLTNDRPIGYFHKNKSDIVHYFHHGSPLTYWIISPDGKLEKIKLGHDINNNQQLQLIIKAGYWKATMLEEGEYGLIGEAVAPGFEYHDWELGTSEKMQSFFPHLWKEIAKYVKTES
jgi:predicted cupin superfamily sugar epimerase